MKVIALSNVKTEQTDNFGLESIAVVGYILQEPTFWSMNDVTSQKTFFPLPPVSIFFLICYSVFLKLMHVFSPNSLRWACVVSSVRVADPHDFGLLDPANY